MPGAGLGAPQCGQMTLAPVRGGAEIPACRAFPDALIQGRRVCRAGIEMSDRFLEPRQDSATVQTFSSAR